MGNLIINDLNIPVVDILDSLRKAIFEDKKALSINELNAIIQRLEFEFETWKKELNALENTFNNIRIHNYRYGLNKSNIKKQIDETSILFEFQQHYYNYLNKLRLHLQKGYILLSKVRETFSNQEITYRILDKDDNGVYFEKIYTIDQLFDAMSFSVEYEKNKKVLQNGIAQIDNFKLVIKTTQKQNIGEDTYKQFSTVFYKQLEKLFLNLKKDGTPNKNGYKLHFNRGHIYELYIYLTETKNFNPNKEIQNFNSEHKSYKLITLARHAARNNNPSYTGGDQAGRNDKGEWQSQQLKNISENSASLINTTTIKNAMNKIIIALKSTDPAEQLIKLFTQDIKKDQGSFTQKFERKLNDAVKKGIQQAFSGLKP